MTLILPTHDAVQVELALLKAMRPSVRRTSMFGDIYHDAMDAQCEVLSKRLSIGQIYEQWGQKNTPINLLTGALTAHSWMTGQLDQEEGAPSDNWTCLVLG